MISSTTKEMMTMRQLDFSVEVSDGDPAIEQEIIEILQRTFIDIVSLLDYCANNFCTSTIVDKGGSVVSSVESSPTTRL